MNILLIISVFYRFQMLKLSMKVIDVNPIDEKDVLRTHNKMKKDVDSD